MADLVLRDRRSNGPICGGDSDFWILRSSPTSESLSRRLVDDEAMELGAGTAFVPPQKVKKKVPQTCEPVAWVAILFDDVEREVVRATERPDRDGEQNGSPNGGRFDQRKNRRKGARCQEQSSLEVDQPSITQVAHHGKAPQNSIRAWRET